jgi:carboxyl-terminal processing protease
VSNEKVTIPLTRGGSFINKAGGNVRANDVAAVRGQPVQAAPTVGEIAKGAAVERLGTFGEFTKVGLGADRFGFIETGKLEETRDRPKFTLVPHLVRSPPLLEVQPAKIASRDDKVHLQGVATDGQRVLDAYIFVGTRKVFYQSNRKATDPKKLVFSLDAQLTPGINVITVVARETEDTATRHTMVVRRDGANGEPLPTPKGELFGEDWEFLEGDEE